MSESGIPDWRKDFQRDKSAAEERARQIGEADVAELEADPSLTLRGRSMTYTALSQFFDRKARTEGRLV